MTQIRHFELELAELRRSLVSMGNLVEKTVELGIQAIQHPNVEARERARIIEQQLDDFETAIEDRCHQMIALQQPLARDLRLVISAMRIVADLEQVGDLAEGITKRASFIARHQGVENPAELATLSQVVLGMIGQAMDAFITGTLDLAGGVIRDEDQADQLTKQCYDHIQTSMQRQPERIKEYTHLLRAVSSLEHIADIAVSIAEEAVYIHRGTVIRHRHEEFDL